jgi:hypothetical protein
MPQLEDIYPVLSCIEFFFLCESFCGAGMSQIFLSYRVAGEDLMIKGIETYNKHQLSLP